MPTNAPRRPAVYVATNDDSSWRSKFRRRGFRHAYMLERDVANRRWIRIEVRPQAGIMLTCPAQYDRIQTAADLAAHIRATMPGHNAVATMIDESPRDRWLYWFKSSGVGLLGYLLGTYRRTPWKLYRAVNATLAREDVQTAKAAGTVVKAPWAHRSRFGGV